MKIDEFISHLPSEVISGHEVRIADNVFRNIFKFSKLSQDDIFYYIGFGNNSQSLQIAKDEFHVRKVIGIDENEKFVINAKNQIKDSHGIEILQKSMECLNLSEASILFFWFVTGRSTETVITFYRHNYIFNYSFFYHAGIAAKDSCFRNIY